MKWSVVLVAFAAACAHAPSPDRPAPAPPDRRARHILSQVEIVYRGEQPFAKRGDEEWSLGDVKKRDMIFSPDRRRFAVTRPPKGRSQVLRVVVRNVAGDPINEFPLYRAGSPEAITWLDNRRLGYLAPPLPAERLSAIYVVHDVVTGEVLEARSGAEFVWGPERRHVAFVAGAGTKQTVVVDGRTVWPRAGTTRLHNAPVWSPDGHGLAVVADGAVAGSAKLVVLLEYDDPHGDLTWNVPKDALQPGLRVFWAGDSKVVIGETALRPRFAAGWERLH